MQVPAREWIKETRYTTLLYFAQLAEEMFWHGARDTYRAPSLDTYHRTDELVRTHGELTRSGVPEDAILGPMFDEFMWYVRRDLTVRNHYRAVWEIVEEKLADKMAKSPPKIEAIRLFRRTISPMYLRKCRDVIESYISNTKIKDALEFRVIVENYFSYLLNSGHAPEHIYFNIQRHFFDRELDQPPARELQDFFRNFPCRTDEYRVFAWVSPDLAAALDGEPQVTLRANTSSLAAKHAEFIAQQSAKTVVSFDAIRAADLVSAAAECARALSLARAVTYTAYPQADLSWAPTLIVARQDYPAGTRFGEPLSALMRRYREPSGQAAHVASRRREVIWRHLLSDEDRNRLLNAINGYADAYQSESPATQLMALWSSLEGLLPTPAAEKPRIVSFIQDVVASQRRLHIENQFRWLHVELAKAYQDCLAAVLAEVTEFQQPQAKLFAAVCFSQYEPTRVALGHLCAHDPLARQKLFALHKSASNCGGLSDALSAHANKVGWQVLRIYRERNRIAHRANPSANVATLIVNLNEYILGVFATFFQLAETQRERFTIDEIYSEISILEDARRRALERIKANPVGIDNAELVAGFPLR